LLVSCLSFNLHYDIVLRKLSQRLSYLRGFKRFMDHGILRKMINAHLFSIADYGLDIWAIESDKLLDDMQRKIDKFLFEFEYPASHREILKKAQMTYTELQKVRGKFFF